MASGDAWNAGWNLGAGYAQQRSAHKQALSDEELQGKIQDLIGQRSALVSKISDLDKDSPEYKQAFDALKQVNMGLVNVYHPQHNEGAIAKFGHLLTDHLGIRVNGETLPQRRKDKADAQAAQKDKTATTQAEQQVAGAPLSPAQLSIAEVNAKVKWIDSSNLSPEDKAEAKRKLFGVSEKPTLKLYASPDGSTKAWLDANRPDSIPVGWTAYATPSAVGTELSQYNDAVAKGYKGTLLQWKKEQSAGSDLKYVAATGQIIDPETHETYSRGDPNISPKAATMFKSIDAMTAKKQAFQMQLATAGRATFNLTRPMQVLDTANGNTPTVVEFDEMRKNPGRYLPSGEGDKALAKENLMADIAGTSVRTRQAINDMDEDFPEDMKIKIVAAMKADDPHAALDQLIASGAVGSLTDKQQNFLIATRQLAENAMAMRSILGAGQGSEDMRSAIRETLPGLLSPDKSYALRQLDAFDATIQRLHRGVPKVPLRTDLGDGTNPTSAVSGKQKVSIAKAKLKPQYKNLTDDQVKQAIEASGKYVAVP
jgi:hypothetical protein